MIQKQKYYYDPETCSFEKVESTWKDWAAYIGRILGLAFVLAIFGIWAMDMQWVSTPQEKTLRAENEALEQQLDQVNNRMGELSSQLDKLAARDERLFRRHFEIEPISEDIRKVGVGGADPYGEFNQMGEETASLLKNTAQKLDKIERQVSLQGSSYRELSEVAEKRQDRLEQLPAIRPAEGPIVSGYGMRHHPILKVRKMHSGVDFLLRVGTPVVATANGVIRRATYNSTYGNHVDIRHPEAGYMTRYAHLSEIPDTIGRGTTIARGDVIGYSGNSGRSTGPHLHYEVHEQAGQTLNPTHFFVPDMTPENYSELEERTQQYRASRHEEESVSSGEAR